MSNFKVNSEGCIKRTSSALEENAEFPSNSEIQLTTNSKKRRVEVAYFCDFLIPEIRRNIFEFCVEFQELIVLGRVCRAFYHETNNYLGQKLLQSYNKNDFFTPFKNSSDFLNSNLSNSVAFYFYSLNNLGNLACSHFKKIFEYYLSHYINLWVENKFDFENEDSIYRFKVRDNLYLVLDIHTDAGLFVFSKFIERYFLSEKIYEEDFLCEDKKASILNLFNLLVNKSRDDFRSIISKFLFHLKYISSNIEWHDENRASEVLKSLKVDEFYQLIDIAETEYCNSYLINSWAEDACYFMDKLESEYRFYCSYEEVCVLDEKKDPERIIDFFARYLSSNTFLHEYLESKLIRKIVSDFLDFFAANKFTGKVPTVLSDLIFHYGQQCNQSTNYINFIAIVFLFASKGLLDSSQVTFFKNFSMSQIKGLESNFDVDSINKISITLPFIHHVFCDNLIELDLDERSFLKNCIIKFLKIPDVPLFNQLEFISFLLLLLSNDSLLKEEDLLFFSDYSFSKLTDLQLDLEFHTQTLCLLERLVSLHSVKFSIHEIEFLKQSIIKKIQDHQLDPILQDAALRLTASMLKANHWILNNEEQVFFRDNAFSKIEDSSFQDLIISFLPTLFEHSQFNLEKDQLQTYAKICFSKIHELNLDNGIFCKTVFGLLLLFEKYSFQFEHSTWKAIEAIIITKLPGNILSLSMLDDLYLFLSYSPSIEFSNLFPYVSADFFQHILAQGLKLKLSSTDSRKQSLIKYYQLFLEHPDPFCRSLVSDILRRLQQVELMEI